MTFLNTHQLFTQNTKNPDSKCLKLTLLCMELMYYREWIISHLSLTAVTDTEYGPLSPWTEWDFINNKSKQMEIQRGEPFSISSSRTERQQLVVSVSVSLCHSRNVCMQNYYNVYFFYVSWKDEKSFKII